jgi:hypothetical protein
MVICGISVRHVAADGRQIPHQRIGDYADGIVQQRVATGDQRFSLEIGLARQGADVEDVPLFANVGKSVDGVEIDDVTRLCQPEAHQRDQTLAAGQQFGVVSVHSEERNGLGERRRGVVGELAWDHGHSLA